MAAPGRHGASAATLLGGCLNSSGGGESVVNVKLDGVGTISEKSYDGTSDNLLTAGLGKAGLGAAEAPVPANPTALTAAELRRLAIFADRPQPLRSAEGEGSVDQDHAGQTG